MVWCSMVQHGAAVYSDEMASTQKNVRQSVSLPAGVARRVRQMAKDKNASANQVLVELIERGIESKEAAKRSFFELADRLSVSTDPAEQQRIKKELARMTFGK